MSRITRRRCETRSYSGKVVCTLVLTKHSMRFKQHAHRATDYTELRNKYQFYTAMKTMRK